MEFTFLGISLALYATMMLGSVRYIYKIRRAMHMTAKTIINETEGGEWEPNAEYYSSSKTREI